MSKTAGRVAASVDPDQTPRSAASDLGLHCLFRHVCPNTLVNSLSSYSINLDTEHQLFNVYFQ